MPSPCLCRAKIYSSADEHAIGSKHSAVPRRSPLDQLRLSPQCGFASTAEGNLLTIEDQIAKLRLVVDGARSLGLTLAEKKPRQLQPSLAICHDPAHISAMLKDFDPSDYSIVVKSRAPLPKPWRWEIYCAGKRQPIQRSDVLFESREQASATGKQALARLLEKLRS